MKISEQKRAYYEKHLAAWKRSGLTQRAYCQQESIAYGTFKSWGNQLRSASKPLQFVEATAVEAEPAASHGLVLQISLANGSRIGVSAQASQVVVEQVLKLVGGQV